MRYRIIGLSHTISHCDIVCDSKIIAYDICVWYRMRYKRYRIIGISHAISQCDIVCDSKCIAHDIAHDIALGYRMRYKRYRIIGISHAISQCDIVCYIIGYRIRYKRYRKCDKKDYLKISHEISLRYRNDAISHAISHLTRLQMSDRNLKSPHQP